MNNNELRARLLIEAADLLAENGSSNNLNDRKHYADMAISNIKSANLIRKIKNIQLINNNDEIKLVKNYEYNDFINGEEDYFTILEIDVSKHKDRESINDINIEILDIVDTIFENFNQKIKGRYKLFYDYNSSGYGFLYFSTYNYN